MSHSYYLCAAFPLFDFPLWAVVLNLLLFQRDQKSAGGAGFVLGFTISFCLSYNYGDGETLFESVLFL